MTTPEQRNAVFIAGELIGTAVRLNIPALESFLDDADTEFNYFEQCRVVLEFAKKVQAL